MDKTSTIQHHTFVIDRRYAHPPEKVFSGFSDPKKKRRWMGGDDDGWTIEKFDMNFEGIHWREVEQLVQPKPSARFAIAHAEQGFTANVPISFLRDEHALLATGLRVFFAESLETFAADLQRARAYGGSYERWIAAKRAVVWA